MKNLNRIMVAIDGSETSQNAASIAIHIAKSLKLDIHGLYVVDEELVMNDYANYQAELGNVGKPISRTDRAVLFEERGYNVLQRLQSRCQESGVPVTIQVDLGGVPEIILQQAVRACLLVLGRRGNGHASSPGYLGHNFRRIVHRARQPRLVGGDKQIHLERLLFAYNGQPHARKVLAWAARLQRCLSSEMMVLGVQESDDANSSRNWFEEIKTQLSQSNLKDFHLLTRYGKPSTEIVEVASESKADLILMGGYRHRVLLEWLTGSTVDTVLRNTPLSVLIV